MRDQSVSTPFLLTGLLANGAVLNGTVLIDTSTGTVSALSLTIGSPTNITLKVSATLVTNGRTFVDLIGSSGPQYPNLAILFPTSTLIGYGGGPLCSAESPCVGASHSLRSGFVLDTGTSVPVTAGSLVPKK